MKSNGQYIAVGCHKSGKVYLWNVTNSKQCVTLQVFQGTAVSGKHAPVQDHTELYVLYK